MLYGVFLYKRRLFPKFSTFVYRLTNNKYNL